FLAICTLSWRIAIISCRLYFITGHWPVVKECDLAQPSPIRIDSDPTLAGSSTAPGSPVTYSPGMPSFPAARVMSMMVLSTVAGASPWEPSWPWPRASKPTQSTAASPPPAPPPRRAAEDLLELLAQVVVLGQVDRLAAEAGRLGQAFLVHVADDDHGRAQQMGRGGAGQPDRAGAGDIDGGAGGHPGGPGAVVAGREDVRQHGQVPDLGHGLVLVGELEQVPVGVGDGHVLGLAAQPAAHVDIAVGGPGPGRVDVLTDPGVALLAVAAAPAGDVEGDADQVADLDVLDVAADLGHLAGDLVAEGLTLGGGGPPADHVLVGAADVGGDDFEDDAVLQLTVVLLGELQLGVVEVLDLHAAGPGVDHALVGIGHSCSLHLHWLCGQAARAGAGSGPGSSSGIGGTGVGVPGQLAGVWSP